MRTFILATGWPALIAGSIFLLYKSIRFYKDVNRVIFGKLVIIMTAGWLFTMYCLGIAATVAMYLDLQIGVFVVLPIFITWAISMVIIVTIVLIWSKEAITINRFYQDIERKYQMIFELSPEAILLVDPSGTIIALNDRLQDWLGYRTNDIVGKSIVTLPFLTEESKAAIMKNFSERLLGKEPPAYNIEVVNKKGEKKYGQVVAATIKSEKGEIIRNLTMISDITNRVKLEMLRDDLMHMIVHDLKTPVFTITESIEMLRSGSSEEEKNNLLAGMFSSSRKMTSLILDMLQIKSMEEKQLALNMSVFGADEIIKELEWLNYYAAKKPVKLEVGVQKDLKITADKSLIIRVIENLATNAIKHTLTNGKIIISIRKDKGQILLEVADSGPGIPQEYQEKVFDKFFKLDDTASNTKLNTGLGLAFCKLAVEAHGGKIQLESSSQKGSRFFFYLPDEGQRVL